MNLKKLIQNLCEKNNFEINPNQLDLIKRLKKYHNQNFNKSFIQKIFSKNDSKSAFYLYGDVGVGKTMILNFFFDQLVEIKLRQHFNEFMLSFHDFAYARKDEKEENMINQFVKDLKSKTKLIYFDEFQVTNIVDAMILGKLFEVMFKEDIKIILTSNTKISELYKDGLQRDQFKPFIKIMEKKSIEYELKIDEDYRKINNNQKQRYFYPLNQETNFIVIDKIPQFNNNNSNQQQRFITLLDVIYDKNISIAVTANQNLNELTSSRLLEKPFKRTISRLYELTSKENN